MCLIFVAEGLSGVHLFECLVLRAGNHDERGGSAALSEKIVRPGINSRVHRSNVTYWRIQATEQLHGQQCEGGEGMQKK